MYGTSPWYGCRVILWRFAQTLLGTKDVSSSLKEVALLLRDVLIVRTLASDFGAITCGRVCAAPAGCVVAAAASGVPVNRFTIDRFFFILNRPGVGRVIPVEVDGRGGLGRALALMGVEVLTPPNSEASGEGRGGSFFALGLSFLAKFMPIAANACRAPMDEERLSRRALDLSAGKSM